MFRAMMSQQQQQANNNTNNLMHQYLSPHAVASTLAQIGVDPGYFSDSECSSNSSDKTAEDGAQNTSPADKQITRIPGIAELSPPMVR